MWLNKDKVEINTYFKKVAVDKLLNEIKLDLQLINVNFDIFTHESKIVSNRIIDKLF